MPENTIADKNKDIEVLDIIWPQFTWDYEQEIQEFIWMLDKPVWPVKISWQVWAWFLCVWDYVGIFFRVHICPQKLVVISIVLI